MPCLPLNLQRLNLQRIERIISLLLHPTLASFKEVEDELGYLAADLQELSQTPAAPLDRALLAEISTKTRHASALLHQAGYIHRNFAELILASAGGYLATGSVAPLPAVHQIAVQG